MQQTALEFDDLAVGMSFTTATRTITEADVTMFASLTGDFSEVHVSRQIADTSEFGDRIAHGLLVLSYAHGLMLGGGLLRPSAIAFAGIPEWRFLGPVLLGDTIHVDFTVAELRRSATKSDRAILTFDVNVKNQRNEVVQCGRKTIMLRTQPVLGAEA